MEIIKRLWRYIRRLLGRRAPTVRLALVGATTSGKTYLLQDIAAALQFRMGYRVTSVPGFLDFSDLNRRTTGSNGAIERSRLYACRTHYACLLAAPGSGTPDCRLEFLDVPGECFEAGALNVFKHVKNQLFELSGNVFVVRTWRRGDHVQRTVHFSDIPDNTDDQGADNAGGTAGVDRYRTTREVMADLKTQGYVADGNDKRIDGREFITHFFDYVTDCALNAISQAWPLIGQAVSEGVGTEISQSAFENVHLRNFYYLYFTYAATDIVFCDKSAMPVSKALTPHPDETSTNAFYDMLTGTMALVGDNKATDKRWYLAFKGMDSLIPDGLYQAIYNRCAGDADLTYSLFVTMLARAINHHSLDIDTDELWRWLTARNHGTDIKNPDELRNDLFTMVDRVVEDEQTYFNAPETYMVNSTDYKHEENAIGDHIAARIYSFGSATHLSADGPVGQFTSIPPHVYFTATPIDRRFKIYGHVDDNLFKGATRPLERLCFGSRQLITDVMLAAGIPLPEGCDDQGKLLLYFFDA